MAKKRRGRRIITNGKTPKNHRMRMLAVTFKKSFTATGIAINRDGCIKLVDTEGNMVDYASAKAEIQEVRPRKWHTLASVPLDVEFPTVDMLFRLRAFTGIIGVDTNSYANEGTRVSLVSINETELKSDKSGGVQILITPYAVFEFHDLPVPSERFGWYVACEVLLQTASYTPGQSIALVVDAHLQDHESLNLRTTPILDDYLLPDGFNLVKGSDRSRGDSLPQLIVANCDKHARVIRDYLEREKPGLPFVTPAGRYPFPFRKWTFKNISVENLGEIDGWDWRNTP